ncbi:MAG: hypothetical protein CMJ84_00080 [Planctomycetes bacterium]|nr:hypothetical protein [Planctomycetota bacterium]
MLGEGQAQGWHLSTVDAETGAVAPIPNVTTLNISLGGTGLQFGTSEGVRLSVAEGISFRAAPALPVGTVVQLQVPTEGPPASLTIRGKVLRSTCVLVPVEDGLVLRYHYGVQFEPEAAAQVAKVLDRLQP